jgi:hypothetical protein
MDAYTPIDKNRECVYFVYIVATIDLPENECITACCIIAMLNKEEFRGNAWNERI